jgi:hypothetical protein
MIMEEAYWLGRTGTSLEQARNAATSEARLVHYEFAGRYSLKAMSAEMPPVGVEDALPPAICASRVKPASQGTHDA